MYEILTKRKSNTFHFEVLVAVIASTFWLRMFLMLKLTKTFGPLIKIIYVMMRELMIFLVLWGIQLFIFSCIGILTFSSIEEYQGFMNVLILFFQSALGIWDFTIYDNFNLGPKLG
jgi:ABC-type transport system involved in cytochrome c biogenesis permease subunit